MKYLLILLTTVCFSQVPDTNNFTLQDVVDVIEAEGCGTSGIESLEDCFSYADPQGFDPAYEGSKDRLSNFRNYYKPSYTSLTLRYFCGQDVNVEYDCNGDGLTDPILDGDIYNMCSITSMLTVYLIEGDTFETAESVYDCTGEKLAGIFSDEDIIKKFGYDGELLQTWSCGVPVDSISLGFSGTDSGACSDFSSNPSDYYLNGGSTFSSATEIYINSSGTTLADTGYYSDGNRVRFWDGSEFTSSAFCSGL